VSTRAWDRQKKKNKKKSQKANLVTAGDNGARSGADALEGRPNLYAKVVKVRRVRAKWGNRNTSQGVLERRRWEKGGPWRVEATESRKGIAARPELEEVQEKEGKNANGGKKIASHVLRRVGTGRYRWLTNTEKETG